MSIVRPIIRPVARALVRRLSHGHGAFNPHVLFAAGEVGAWYDPSDFSTMFQDSVGTTPVTATGQPVGKILDKSGRGNHATQGTAGSRPTLQQDSGGRYYLNFDGVDDGLVSSAIDFSSTGKATIIAGVYKGSDAAAATLVDLYNGGANTFRLLAPGNAAPNFQFSVSGGAGATVGRAATFTAPYLAVLTGQYNVAAATTTDQVSGRVNAAPQTLAFASGPTTGGTTFLNQPLYICRSQAATQPLTGRLYGLIVRGASTSASRIIQAENWMNSKTGAY